MSTLNQLSDTPRTDAAWAKTFQDDEDQCRAGNAATDMRDACATLERELGALTAEVKRLKRAYEYDHKCLYEVRDRCHLWKQRAEKAEAQLHALRLVCGTTDANKFETWTDRANARAERAEAELAKERARLDWLLLDNLTRFDDSFSHRTAIDAAMKEAAK